MAEAVKSENITGERVKNNSQWVYQVRGDAGAVKSLFTGDHTGQA